MARRGGSAHVATVRTKGKGGKVYTSYLLRRSYREGGKVRHENLGNLSHLPIEVIEAVRAMLGGRRLVDLDEDFEICRSLPHGHVAAVLGVLRELDLERLIGRERSRERDLVVAMVCQRLIGPGSKLSCTRRFGQTTLGEELALGEVNEAELLAAMGHSRDGVRGKPQVNWGLVCSPEGRPVAVQVHEGNTADPSTLPDVLETVGQRFGIERVVFVGDRAMITRAHADKLKQLGAGFVSALK